MTDAELNDRLLTNVIAFKHLQRERGLLRHGSAPGMDAFALPEYPAEAHFQQAYFRTPQALVEGLPALEAFYRGLDIPAWRVAVLPGDDEGARVLGAAGYQPDSRIPAMGLALADTPDLKPSFPLVEPETQDEMVELNIRVWGKWDDILTVWRQPPRLPVHTLVAREGARALACGFALDVEDTAGVYMVVTLPEARGRGLAAEVMRGLLTGARERGLSASVLQATEQGRSVYRKLGYRELGDWVNWTRRAD
ncbi:GNAT family N-acetyltransferase [Myxococcus sp. CA051A]|uniref:GNAT family N-acetyltransferase n=1 Tax=unclassified Myxococcus TaxID=2648731 RepID=UPI00157B4471|nr:MULTISPECIES: GNAT family N-acetyltransferase [unclassified Myxococcus]NTX37566.1 GNAT family N-acetyltransferase [Myxococcus sp. CA033]NTX67198.1 GNAT family N-acetyltransferase [Myxococcus sp. CA051A]